MASIAAEKKQQGQAIAMVPMGQSTQPLVVTLTGRNNDFSYPTQSEVYDEIILSKGYTQVRDDTDPTGFKNRRGSSNFAYFFKHPDPTHKPQELVFRRTREQVIFDGKTPKVSNIETLYNQGYIREDKDSIRSRSNWLESARLNIAPQIYFYGYIKKPNQNSGLYLAVVSEGFDTDLHHFYSDVYTPALQGIPTNALTPTDIAIQRQITQQLNTTAKVLELVCFDIKPLNTVISYKQDGCHKEASLANPIVRLIDWDGDYCIKYSDHMNEAIEIRESTTSIGRHGRQVTRYTTTRKINKDLEAHISNIIMANHFFVNFDRNIFAEYFNSKKQELESLKPKLAEYFCSVVYGDPDDMFGSDAASLYHFFSRHYLQQRDQPIPGRIDVSPFKQADKNHPTERPGHAMCRKLFREMYKRIFVINEAALAAQPQLAAQSVAQLAAQPVAQLAAQPQTEEKKQVPLHEQERVRKIYRDDMSSGSESGESLHSDSDYRTAYSRGGKRKKRTRKTRHKTRRKHKKRHKTKRKNKKHRRNRNHNRNRKNKETRKHKKRHRRKKKSRKH